MKRNVMSDSQGPEQKTLSQAECLRRLSQIAACSPRVLLAFSALSTAIWLQGQWRAFCKWITSRDQQDPDHGGRSCYDPDPVPVHGAQPGDCAFSQSQCWQISDGRR